MMVRSLRALAVAVGLLWPGAAWACSCASVGPDEFFADQFVAGVGILFEGIMLRTENVQPPTRGLLTGVFKVVTVHKGELGSLARITYQQADGANCGTSFRTGKRVFVAAHGDAERGYYTGMCTQGPVSFGEGNDEIMAAIQRYRLRLTGLDLAIARNPGSVDPVIAKARFLGSTSQQAAALRLLDDVLAREPNARVAVLLAALLHSDTQHDEQALAVLDPYLSAHPTDHDAARARVLSLIRLGRSAEVPADWRDFSGLVRQRYGPAAAIDFANRALDGASFRGADLTNIDFTASVLKGGDFSATRLWESHFDRADLTGADFRKADISGTFADTDLRGAKLTGGSFRVVAPRANLEGADLAGASFRQGSSLTGVRAANIHAPRSQYELRDMAGIDFTGANLRGAMFYSSDLRAASFRDADLTGAQFRNMLSATQPIDLRGVDLTGARLDGVTFAAVLFDCDTRWPAGYDLSKHPLVTTAPDAGACAKKADFSWLREPVLAPGASRYSNTATFANQNFAGVSFHGAWLPGSDFWGANLRGADFARSKGGLTLTNADATGADFSHVYFYHSRLFGVGNGSRAAILDGAIFRGTLMRLRTMKSGRDDWHDPDLSKAQLDGMIFADEPEKWPGEIDPVKAGIVFLDSTAAMDRFDGYSLKGRDLRFFDLDHGNFMGIDLSGADLRGAQLDDANLSGANLVGSKLKGACYATGTKWPAGMSVAAAGVVYCGRVGCGGSGWLSSGWSHINGGLESTSRFYVPASDTPVPDFAGENWDEVFWLGAWLPGSNMEDGSFRHATMKGVNLNSASLKGADLTGADLKDGLAEGADFTNAILRDADLRMTSLKDATLTGADLTGAAYDDRTVWPAGIDPVKAGAEKIAPVQP